MTRYEVLKLNRTLFETLIASGVNVNDVTMLDAYDEYVSLRREGHKSSYAAAMVEEKFGVSRSTLFRIVKKFGTTVKI